MYLLAMHGWASVFWNGVYTIYYRSAYSLYLILLYATTDTKTFGLVGTFFSLLYLAEQMFQVGFAESLVPYFSTITSKQSCKHFFSKQLAIHAFFIVILILCGSLYYCYTNKAYCLRPSAQLFCILGIIFLLEFINKILKKLLRLALYYRSIALIEIVSITLFLGLIGIASLLCLNITVEYVFASFLIHSCAATTALIYNCTRWYKHLPNSSSSTTNIVLLTDLFFFRFLSHVTTMGSTLFSSNFLIPLIALSQGVEVVAVYKLVGNVAHNIDLFLEHAFSQSGESILCNIPTTMANAKQNVFKHLNKHTVHCSILLLILLSINYSKIFKLIAPSLSNHLVLCLLFYFLILLNSSLFSAYKSLFAIQKSYHYFAAIKAFSILCASYFVFVSGLSNMEVLLGSLLLVQCFSLAVIVTAAYCLWRIPIPCTLRPIHIAQSVIFSLALFFIL